MVSPKQEKQQQEGTSAAATDNTDVLVSQQSALASAYGVTRDTATMTQEQKAKYANLMGELEEKETMLEEAKGRQQYAMKKIKEAQEQASSTPMKKMRRQPNWLSPNPRSWLSLTC